MAKINIIIDESLNDVGQEDWMQTIIHESYPEEHHIANGQVFTIGDPVSIAEFEEMARHAINIDAIYNDKNLIPDEGGWFDLEVDRLIINGWTPEDAREQILKSGVSPYGKASSEDKKFMQELAKTYKWQAEVRDVVDRVRLRGGIRTEEENTKEIETK